VTVRMPSGIALADFGAVMVFFSSVELSLLNCLLIDDEQARAVRTNLCAKYLPDPRVSEREKAFAAD
jgi:hypothetical protein